MEIKTLQSDLQSYRHVSVRNIRWNTLSLAFSFLLNLLLLSSTFGQTVVGTITRPGLAPAGLAVYEKGNKLCVFDDRTNHLLIYDCATLNLKKEIIFRNSISDPFSYVGMAVNEKEGKLYACLGHENWPEKWVMIAVVDLVSDSLSIEIPILGLLPQSATGIAYDPEINKIFLCGFHNNVFTVDLNTNVVTKLNIIATHLALNPLTHEVFIASGTDIWILNGNTLHLTFWTKVDCFQIYDMTMNWIENKLYLITAAPFTTHVLDRDDGSVKELDDVNDSMSLFFSPGGNLVYTSAEIACKSTVIDGQTDNWYYLPMEGGAPSMGFRNSTKHSYFVGEKIIAAFDEISQMLVRLTFDHPHAETGSSGEQHIAVNQTTGQVFVTRVSLYNPPDDNPIWVIQDTPMLTHPNVLLGCKVVTVIDADRNDVLNYWDALDGTGYYNKIEGITYNPRGGRAYVVRRGKYGAAQMSVHAGCNTWDKYNSYGAGDFSAVVGYTTMNNKDPITPISSPDGSIIYVTCSASGVLQVVDVTSDADLKLRNEIAVGKTPWGSALTPDGALIYVANRGSNDISIINTSTYAVTQTIPVGSAPWGVAINPSGKLAYVANSGSGTVSVIDVVAGKVITNVQVESNPHWLSFSPDGKFVYVTNNVSGSVSVIDAGTQQVIRTINVGSYPEGICFYPNGSKVYVAKDSGACIIDPTSFLIDHFIDPDYSTYYSVAIANPTSRFAGRVTNLKGLPVVNALVRATQDGVEKGTATTNAAGDFSIFYLQNGTYDLELSGPDFALQSLMAQQVNAGQTKIVHFSVPTSVKSSEQLPHQFSLTQNYPNPFNPKTTISYSLPKSSYVTLKVFDSRGSEVATLVSEYRQAGNYEVVFDGSTFSSGVYFYQIIAGKFVRTKKLILLK